MIPLRNKFHKFIESCLKITGINLSVYIYMYLSMLSMLSNLYYYVSIKTLREDEPMIVKYLCNSKIIGRLLSPFTRARNPYSKGTKNNRMVYSSVNFSNYSE